MKKAEINTSVLRVKRYFNYVKGQKTKYFIDSPHVHCSKAAHQFIPMLPL